MADLDRVDVLTPDRFLADYLVPRVPVVVTGEVGRWRASTTWSWTWLAERFGDRPVDVCDDWFVPTAVMPLGEFVRDRIGTARADPATSYVRWFARNGPGPGHWADEVFDALRPDWSQPAFLPAEGYLVPYARAGERLDAARDPFPYRGLFLSARGARTRLHRDPWAGAAALCQLTGVKRVRLYAPEQEAQLIEAAAAGDVTAERVPPARSGPLEAGEVLFVPDGWWHQVDTEADSISLTWNFVHRAVADRLAGHVRALPDDPELAVVAYFLNGRVPGTAATSAAQLVDAAMAGP
jgi:Cupin-like domain